MLKRCFRDTVAGLSVAAVTLAAVNVLAAKPPRKVREALGSTRALYTITQQGRDVGSETIVRTDYNDNTVGFTVHDHLEVAAGTAMDSDVEFTVTEESFYPLAYRQTKQIDQSGSKITIGNSIEMFANVAVMTTKSANAEGTRKIVLPTGTAFVETGTIYTYEEFLFWYDHNLGGRQNFNAMDVSSGKEEEIVVHLIAQDTVSVDGKDVPVDVYKLQRKQFDVTLYVDGSGRMVRVEQNFMTFDLKEWSREAAKAQ